VRPVDDDEKGADSGGNNGPSDGAPRRRHQRKPDGNEPIDGDEDHYPGGHVLREQDDELNAAAQPVADSE